MTIPARRPTIATAMHDGYYGVGTGAGYANKAFLDTLVHALADDVQLFVLPVRLASTSSEFDAAWHTHTEQLVQCAGGRVLPVDNGTHGAQRFGNVAAFRQLATYTADVLTHQVLPGAGPFAAVLFDVPFLGVPLHLPRDVLRHVTAVPRSTAVLHDPTNTERITYEHAGLHALARHGGRIAVISAHMRQHLQTSYHLPPAALLDLADGLTPKDRVFNDPDPQLIPPAAQSGFIFAMGRATPYKGWDDLVDALATLHYDGGGPPHAVLAAVIDQPIPSPYQQHLAARIRRLQIPATLISRFSPKIRDLLTHPALRCVVVPSRAEPFGRIPLEAFAAGATPVVATTAGGLTEQVMDGLTGITASPSDPDSLALAIRRALTLTPTQRDTMRRTAHRHAGQHDYIDSTIRFLQQVAPWATTDSYLRRPCPSPDPPSTSTSSSNTTDRCSSP